MNGRDQGTFIAQYGTQAERLALDTAQIKPLTAWYETDTTLEYKWFGAWFLYPGAAKGGGGGVSIVTSGKDTQLLQGSKAINITKRGIARHVYAMDSTGGYMFAVSPNAAAAVYNGDGTATYQFTLDQSLKVGDIIGVQGAADHAYNMPCSQPILAVSGAGPFFYTIALRPKMLPQTTPDTSPNVTLMFEHQKTAYTLVGNVRTLLGPQVEIINVSIGGDTTTDIVQRAPYDIGPLKPQVVYFSGAINNIYKNLATPGAVLPQVQADALGMYTYCQSIGAEMRLIGPPPQLQTRVNWSTSTRDLMFSIQKFYAQFAQSYGLKFYPWHQVGAGSEVAQQPLDANGNASTGMINPNAGDLIHPTNKLGMILARRIADDVFAEHPQLIAENPRNITDTGLYSNGLFNTAGGTATGSGVGGQVPLGCTLAILAGAPTSITGSLVARTVEADGDQAGNWYYVTMVAAAAGDGFHFDLPDLHTTMVQGSTYRLESDFTIVQGATLCNEVSVRMVEQTGGAVNKFHWLQEALGTPQPWAEAFTGSMYDNVTLRTNANAGGTLSLFIARYNVTASAAGTITVRFGVTGIDVLPAAAA